MERSDYTVLARSSRPQQLGDVVGQEHVTRTLANALEQQRLAHAYCFSGIRGVGKTTIARILAKGLNCRSTEGPTATPCEQCESCIEIVEGRAIDVIERDAASDRGIDDMKQLIEISRYAPSRDRYKVMILDEAHMLTKEASNALLKVLEEPPPYIVFALATTEPSKILPTILSRCQHYQLARIGQREIEAHLGKLAAAGGVTISADGLALVATAADGSMRDALSLLDKLVAFAGDAIDEATVVDLLGLIDRVLLFRAVDLIAAENVAGTLELVDEMVQQGVDLHQFTVDLLGHFRNLLVVRTVPDPGTILHLPAADLESLNTQAQHFEIDDLDRAFSLLAGSEYRIKMAEQPRYHVEVVLARLARMPRLQPLQDIIASLEGGASGGAPAGGSGDSGRSASSASAATASTAPTAPASEPAPPVTDPAPVSAPEPAAPAPDLAPVSPPEPAAPAPGPAPAPVATEPEPVAAPTPEPAPAPTPAPAPAPAPERGTGSSPTTIDENEPSSGLLARIQAQLNATHPLVAQSLSRTCGIDLAGESIAFRFPATAELFASRFKDPEIAPALQAACEAALGRSVVPRIEIDPNGVAPVRETKPDKPLPPEPNAPPANPDPTPAPPPFDDAPHPAEASAPTQSASVPVPPAAEPTSPSQDPAPAPPAARQPKPASAELRQQVENSPGVQQLLNELKGSVLSVEEL